MDKGAYAAAFAVVCECCLAANFASRSLTNLVKGFFGLGLILVGAGGGGELDGGADSCFGVRVEEPMPRPTLTQALPASALALPAPALAMELSCG